MNTIKFGQDPKRDCAQYKALDVIFCTPSGSAMHHDSRCSLCLKEVSSDGRASE